MQGVLISITDTENTMKLLFPRLVVLALSAASLWAEAALKPSELTVPRQVLDSIPPRPPGYSRHRELFPRTTGDAFDERRTSEWSNRPCVRWS